jgi:hypothetical protein
MLACCPARRPGRPPGPQARCERGRARRSRLDPVGHNSATDRGDPLGQSRRQRYWHWPTRRRLARIAVWLPQAHGHRLGHLNANYWRVPARGFPVQPAQHVRTPSRTAVARMSCCTSLLYGMTGVSKNIVKPVLTSSPTIEGGPGNLHTVLPGSVRGNNARAGCPTRRLFCPHKTEIC